MKYRLQKRRNELSFLVDEAISLRKKLISLYKAHVFEPKLSLKLRLEMQRRVDEMTSPLPASVEELKSLRLRTKKYILKLSANVRNLKREQSYHRPGGSERLWWES